ncbi:DNA-binding protein [Zoogloea sp.]|uniref:DNA-binding protein n=1 Tax=Zoogloea sp. TaxID=49181 RepID=UPI0035B1622A
MVRKLVTQELVTTIADAIVAEGRTPSIIEVRERVGGGSFTTVKRYLDAWHQGQAEANMAALDMPSEFEEKAHQFTLNIWKLASRLAADENQVVKKHAAAQIAAVHNELDVAFQEISRLEGIEAKQAECIDRQQAELHRSELELAEVRTQASRALQLEQALSECREQAASKAEEFARLSGETEALRSQVRDLMVALSTIRVQQGDGVTAGVAMMS